MSIASEITRLQGVKADILTAIADKGVTVPADSALDDCPDLIDSIQTGGSGLPDGWKEANMLVCSNDTRTNISLGNGIPEFSVAGDDLIEITGVLQRNNGIPGFNLISIRSGYIGYNFAFVNESGNMRFFDGNAFIDLTDITKSCAFKITRASNGTLIFRNGAVTKQSSSPSNVGGNATMVFETDGSGNCSGCGIHEIKITSAGGTLKHHIVPAWNGNNATWNLIDKVTGNYQQIAWIGDRTIV